MTDTASLRAESRALISYGVKRYEDSVLYTGISRYLLDVGTIPDAAWGTLPNSDQLRRDWAAALNNRMLEARSIHDEMERMSDGITQIATDYEGTDLQVRTNFDVVNKDLAPYIETADGYTDQVRTRAGGVGILNGGYPVPAERGGSTVVIPPGNDRLTATRQEVFPTTRVVDEPLVIGSNTGNDLTVSGGRTTYYENGEQDHLNQFVQEYSDTLLQLEAFLQELATGQRLPLSDLIIHAWRTAPKVIRNRADLIHSVANTYAESRAEMDGETKRLGLYWDGPAAAAFTQYAASAGAYLGQVETQARWLAEEGKKAASMLEGLRNAYAIAGYERIGQLVNAMTEYRTRLQGMFDVCDNAEQKLIEAVAFFLDALSDAEARHVQALADLIKVQEQERKERPDMGSRGHDAVPFPKLDVGDNAWTRGDGWGTKQSRPSL